MPQTVESVYNVGDLSSIPGLGRFLGEGNGNLLQYSCLENPMDGGEKRKQNTNTFLKYEIKYSIV